MRALFLYAFYSGQLFFVAAACFGAFVFLPKRVRVLALLALGIAILTAPPFPLWLAIPLLAAPLIPPRKWFAVAAAVVAIAVELPYHVRRPVVPRPAHLTVIGDSLASGGFGESQPWPELLGVPVTNLALPSDTAEMAVANQLPQVKGMLIVEIGGNDMLDGTPARNFEAALERMVSSQPRVILLELPLLLGRWHYGAIQRRLAKKHGAVLVPKRILARVLTGEGNTSDGIHLTQRGHEALARELRAWLRW